MVTFKKKKHTTYPVGPLNYSRMVQALKEYDRTEDRKALREELLGYFSHILKGWSHPEQSVLEISAVTSYHGLLYVGISPSGEIWELNPETYEWKLVFQCPEELGAAWRDAGGGAFEERWRGTFWTHIIFKPYPDTILVFAGWAARDGKPYSAILVNDKGEWKLVLVEHYGAPTDWNEFYTIAEHGAGRLVAAGEHGRIFTSTDGIKWDYQKTVYRADGVTPVPLFNIPRGEVFGGYLYLGDGGLGDIYRFDLDFGYTRISPTAAAAGFESLRSIGGTLYAVDIASNLYSSTDGLTFTRMRRLETSEYTDAEWRVSLVRLGEKLYIPYYVQKSGYVTPMYGGGLWQIRPQLTKLLETSDYGFRAMEDLNGLIVLGTLWKPLRAVYLISFSPEVWQNLLDHRKPFRTVTDYLPPSGFLDVNPGETRTLVDVHGRGFLTNLTLQWRQSVGTIEASHCEVHIEVDGVEMPESGLNTFIDPLAGVTSSSRQTTGYNFVRYDDTAKVWAMHISGEIHFKNRLRIWVKNTAGAGNVGQVNYDGFVHIDS